MSYDLIIVGSGNGACGFLTHYQQALKHHSVSQRVLVLEEGEDFYSTSDLSHLNNWTKSFAEEKVFKLHNALTPDHLPIISGRACCMGGAGSINVSMIHESSQWLAQHIGHTPQYWDDLKKELNQRFNRPDPTEEPSAVTTHIVQLGEKVGFVESNNATGNIPNLEEGEEGEVGKLHLFPTQFNSFGQRTNSGVSIVDWFGGDVEIKTRCRVEKLEFGGLRNRKARVVAVHVKYLETGVKERITLERDAGRLVLCAGADTPRLLWPHQKELGNEEIGRYVKDHILVPLGIYLVDKEVEVVPQDVYVPVFATTVWRPEEGQQGEETVCCFDFFAGSFERLSYMAAHLYLALILPNWAKRLVLEFPWMFIVVKNLLRIVIALLNLIIDGIWGVCDLVRGRPWHEKPRLISAIIKFNPARNGCYLKDDSRIELDFFGEDEGSGFNQDKEVAKSEIGKYMGMLNGLGEKPHWLVRWLLRLIIGVPYDRRDVDEYVDAYSRKFLLSEQHMAGGCLFGKAIDKGLDDPLDTGKVYGTENVHVADLSAVPLPRISTQMTAYLIGFHVAKKLCEERE